MKSGFCKALAAASAVLLVAGPTHVVCEGDVLLETGAEVAVELWDKNANGLDEAEVQAMIDALTGGAVDACPSAHAVLNASGVAEGQRAQDPETVGRVVANLYPCVTKLVTASSVRVEVDGLNFECHVAGAGAHDDHDHDHGRLLAEDDHDHDHGDEEVFPVVMAGSEALECDKVDLAEELKGDFSASTWLKAIGASLILSVCSLFGVVLVLFCSNRLNADLLNDAVAFAIGVLLSTVFVHMLPEGVKYSSSGYSWQFGALFLGGLFTAFAVELVSNMLGHGGHHHDTHDLYNVAHMESKPVVLAEDAHGAARGHQDGVETGVVDLSIRDSEVGEGKLKSASVSDTAVAKAHDVDYSLVTNIVVADLFHNLTDGFLVGIAFSFCADSNLGWVVTGAIAAHELPQELVDFLILVRAGLSYKMALFWNFVSSLSAVIGCIVVLALGESLSMSGRAMLLAFGGGFLVYIALAELVPTLVSIDSPRRKVVRFGLAVLGAVLIGLLQLVHIHCDNEPGSHAGHDH